MERFVRGLELIGRRRDRDGVAHVLGDRADELADVAFVVDDEEALLSHADPYPRGTAATRDISVSPATVIRAACPFGLIHAAVK
jgi:hypothetical protein